MILNLFVFDVVLQQDLLECIDIEFEFVISSSLQYTHWMWNIQFFFKIIFDSYLARLSLLTCNCHLLECVVIYTVVVFVVLVK